MEKQQNNTQGETSTNDFAVGTIVFEKFEILGFIAAGGKGRVYKARDVLLNNVVALKVLLGEGRNEKDLVRFQSEARTASRLKHRNIATIYDFGLSGGSPYLSMEFVEGQSLEKILENEKTLSLQIFAEVFIQVCEALIHAHKNGVVHRDLKPGNIAIREVEGEPFIAKVLDFGVAKRIDALVEQEGRLTPTGDIVGSPLYMSPEQAQGQAVTPQSDVYSLGCVMWNCLVGEPPFVSDTAMETIVMHQKSMPAKVSERMPDCVPDELSELIHKMLSKGPEQRGNLEQILSILTTIGDDLAEDELEQKQLDRENIELFEKKAATASDTNVVPRTTISKPVIFTVAAIIFSIVAIICWTSLNSKTERSLTEKIADLHPSAVPTEFAFSWEDKSAQHSTIATSHSSREVLFRTASVDENIRDMKNIKSITSFSAAGSPITDKGISYLADAVNLYRLDLSGTQVKTLDGIGKFKYLELLELKNTKITDQSLANLAGLKKLSSLTLTNVPLTDHFVEYLPSLPLLSNLDLSGTTVSAKALTELKKEPYLMNLILKETPFTVPDITLIVRTLPALSKVDLTDCANLSRKDLESLGRAFPVTSFGVGPSLFRTHEDKAIKAEQQRLFSPAKHYYDLCLADLESQFGNENPQMMGVLIGAGRTALQKENQSLFEAEPYFARARILGQKYKNPQVEMDALDNLANFTLTTKNFKEAEPLYARAHKLAEDRFREENPKELDRRCNLLAPYYIVERDWPEAARLYEESADLRKKLYGSDFPLTAVSMLNAADCLRSMNSNARAAVLYKNGLKTMERTGPQDSTQTRLFLMAYAGLAQIEFLDSHANKALGLSEKCCRLSKTKDKGVYTTALEQRIAFFEMLKRPKSEIQNLMTELSRVRKRSK